VVEIRKVSGSNIGRSEI